MKKIIFLLSFGWVLGCYPLKNLSPGKPAARQEVSVGEPLFKVSALTRNQLPHWLWPHAPQFSPNGELLVTIADKEVKDQVQLWNAKTGALSFEVTLRDRIAGFPSFSPDSAKLLIKMRNQIVVLDTRTGEHLFHINKFHSDGMRYSPDGSFLYCQKKKGTTFFSASTGEKLFRLSSSDDGGSREEVVFSSDHQKILTIGERRARVWSAKDGELLFSIKNYVSWVGFSSDGARVISLESAKLTIRNAATGDILFQSSQTEFGLFGGGSMNNGEIQPRGEQVIASNNRGSAIVFDAKTGAQLFEIRGHQLSSYSPSGAQIVVDPSYGSAYLVDSVRGEPKLKGESEKGFIFSPNNTQVLGVSSGQVWELDSETLLFRLPEPDVRLARYSPDSTKIVVWAAPNVVNIFDSSSGSLLFSFTHPAEKMFDIEWSPDSSQLATFGEGVIAVWSM